MCIAFYPNYDPDKDNWSAFICFYLKMREIKFIKLKEKIEWTGLYCNKHWVFAVNLQLKMYHSEKSAWIDSFPSDKL